MAAPAASSGAEGEQRRGGRPGWMSIPGGPKEPNFQDFIRKLQGLNTDKSKLYDKLDEYRNKSGKGGEGKEVDPARKAFYDEQQAIRSRIGGLRDEQKKEREMSVLDRSKSVDEANRKERAELKAQQAAAPTPKEAIALKKAAEQKKFISTTGFRRL